MRIRTIKPEFWQHEDLSSLPPETHILAAALLNYADDEGYFNANPRLVQAQCVPLRDDSTNIRRSLDDLSSIGYLTLHEGSDGKQYGHITKFLDHQRVDRPKASKIKGLIESTNNRRTINDESPQEGKGREGKGIKDFSSDSCEPDADDTDKSPEAKGGDKPAKYTQADRDMAAHMLTSIREVSPSAKGSKGWPDTIRLMRERDGRTHDEIQAMFAWANADDFWRAVILSPGNLREKWPQLEAQRSRKAGPAKVTEIRRPRKSLMEEYNRA